MRGLRILEATLRAIGAKRLAGRAYGYGCHLGVTR